MSRPDDPPQTTVDRLDPDVTVAPAGDVNETLAPDAPGTPAVDARAPAGYAIERELGRGGMGVVYLARHLDLDRRCALKMILSGAHADSAEAERFRTEAQAVARLQHPGIVQVFEIGEHDGRPFMALEYCPGGSLADKLARHPLPPREAAELVRRLAGAVQVAHDAKLIHRDLKPANILLAADGSPKITDFGLAKKLDEPGATRTGSVMGTPSYMPPEQAEGKREVGPPADIYALGAILYECLTGRPPFRAATVVDTLRQVLDGAVLPVRQLNPAVPRDLDVIVQKCLRKEPARRYGSAREFAEDLSRLLRGEPIQARPVGRLERAVKWVQRNPVVTALTAAVVLTLAAGLVVSNHEANRANNEATRAGIEEGKAKAKEEEARLAAAAAIQAGKEAKTQEGLAKAKAQEAEEQAVLARKQTALTLEALAKYRDQLNRAELARYAGRLAHAQREFDEGYVLRALELLEGSQQDLRHLEFAHLWTRYSCKQTFTLPRSTITFGGAAAVHAVAFTPDGKSLVTGSGEGDCHLRFWDAATGQERRTLKGHTGSIKALALAPDGLRLASVSQDQTLKIWDVATGQMQRSHRILFGTDCLAYSPNGKRLASGGSDGIRIWDAESGKQLLHLKRNQGSPSFRGFVFTPDGKHLVSCGGFVSRAGFLDRNPTFEGHVTVWDAEQGQELRSLPGIKDMVTCLALSPDGRRIAAAIGSGERDSPSKTGEVKVWPLDRDGEPLTLAGQTQPVACLKFSPDGARLVAGEGSVLRSWNALTGQPLAMLKGHTSAIRDLAFSPDGRRLASAGGDGRVKTWDGERGQEVTTYAGHADKVQQVAVSPDGKLIASASDDHQVLVRDARSGHVLGHYQTGGPALCVRFSPDSKRLAAGGRCPAIRVWDLATGKELAALVGHVEFASALRFSPDGTRLASGGPDGVRVWDLETNRQSHHLGQGIGNTARAVVFFADGKRLASAHADRTVKVWDLEAGQHLFNLAGHEDILYDVAVAPGGRLISASRDGTLKVWDLEKRQAVATLKGHTQEVWGVAVSPDGKRIASSSGVFKDWTRPGEVFLWDLETGLQLLALRGHASGVTSVAWSPDGTYLTTGSWDRTVKVWDARKPDGSWPLPEAPARAWHHREAAALAEKESNWCAVAFHVGRLLLDDPDNAALKRRRDEALKKHAGP